MKPQASSMIPFAYAYLGTPYSEMDCQAFVEAVLRDVGIRRDLSGSNAWYRAMTWTGTPEECRQKYGRVPPGAFLYILQDVSSSTPGKYRDDGIGDAIHMGICTGDRGKGAIHSSKRRGGVVESDFKGKTISGGGWNRVGLDETMLTYSGDGDGGDGTMDTPQTATVVAMSGDSVKMRARPGFDCSLYWDIPDGAQVELRRDNVATDRDGYKWIPISYNGRDGWMVEKYLAIDAPEGTGGEDSPADQILVAMPRTLAAALYDILGGALHVVG